MPRLLLVLPIVIYRPAGGNNNGSKPRCTDMVFLFHGGVYLPRGVEVVYGVLAGGGLKTLSPLLDRVMSQGGGDALIQLNASRILLKKFWRRFKLDRKECRYDVDQLRIVRKPFDQ